jgi:hypothetical protein
MRRESADFPGASCDGAKDTKDGCRWWFVYVVVRGQLGRGSGRLRRGMGNQAMIVGNQAMIEIKEKSPPKDLSVKNILNV